MENYKKIPEYWDTMGHITASDCPEKQWNLYKEVFGEDDEEGVSFTLKDFEQYIFSLREEQEAEIEDQAREF